MNKENDNIRKVRTIIIDGVEIQTSLNAVEIADLEQKNKELKEKEKEKLDLLNKMKNKYKLALFMIIRNSSILPNGINLGKSSKEINKMAYETMCETLTMIDYKKAKKMYEEGKNKEEK